MLYDEVLNKVKTRQQNKLTGIYNSIPYPFPKLNEYLSGVERGQAIALLGPTGSGKSKWTRYTFLYHIYKFHLETDYPVRILYFSMEDAKEKVYEYVICNYLFEVHDIKVTKQELNSSSRVLPDFVLEKIEEAREYFNRFESIVTFIDGETEPTKLYNYCESIAMSLGEVENYFEVVEGKKIKQSRYHSDTHVVAIFDNMSNIDTEDGTSNEQAAILKFVKEYMRLRLCNFFKWTAVMVMQLDFESEKQTFNKNGESIIAKIEPGLHSVGDSKRSTRSFHLIFSLFSPHRYDLLKYPIPSRANPQNYYDIGVLGNNFRSLKVIKSNDTDYGMRVGLLFDGISEVFEELPKPGDGALESIYKKFGGRERFNKAERENVLILNESEEGSPF